MISRRNIRVKVMQTLYTSTILEKKSEPENAEKILKNHFEQTRHLLIYITDFLSETCLYSQTDAQHRASKHLPSYEDLHVNTRISGNRVIRKLLDDRSFREARRESKSRFPPDPDFLKKTYIHLKDTDEYKSYILKNDLTEKEEREILEFILDKMMLDNEAFLSHVEELFTNWEDDGEMVIQLLLGILHKPGHFNFQETMNQEKKDFAIKLLKTVLEKGAYLQQFIIPKLKNWDPERIAMLDMVLMKMGVAEFLYFETIPPKVTINEYIDLAKEYSTPQSGQFVNGILDNIHKELVREGGMKKTEYRKV